MSGGIYEFFPNGRLMEIVNHFDGRVEISNTIVAIPLSEEEKSQVLALKEIGLSEKEIFQFRHGYIDKSPAPPELPTNQRLFKINLGDLPKKQLLEIIEKGLELKVNSLKFLPKKDLLKLTDKIIEFSEIKIVVVH